MRGHARVSALIRMDIVQLREHHLRRARAHPLILSTFLPAEAMPPSGHPLILSKESAASVAASASLSVVSCGACLAIESTCTEASV